MSWEWFNEYKKYLSSNHWKNLRERKLESSGRFCRRCGSTKNLQVHHLSYDNLADTSLNQLEVLCVSCHSREHGVQLCRPIKII